MVEYKEINVYSRLLDYRFKNDNVDKKKKESEIISSVLKSKTSTS